MQENKLPNKLIPFLWTFLKKYKLAFYSMLFVGILLGDTGYFFVSPYILKAFVNGLTDGTLSILHGLILIFLYAFADLMPVFDILVNYLQFNSIVRAIEDIRQSIFKYSLKQSTNFFNTNYSGNLTSKISSITNTLLSSNQQFIFGVRPLFFFIFLVIILSSVRVIFGFLAIIWLVLYCLLNFNFIKKINKKSITIQNIRNNISGLITDDFVNASNIKAFSSVTQERKKLSSILRELFNAKIKLAKLERISNLSIFLVNFVIISTIIGISLLMTVNKEMNIGEFFFMLEMVKKLGMMSGYILDALNDSTKNISTMQENLNLITDDIEIKDKPNAQRLSVDNGKIIFKNIRFKY